jgi:hypothetical protein
VTSLVDRAESVTTSAPLLRPERLCADGVRQAREPFAYLIATDLLDDRARIALQGGFPAARQAGFIPHEAADCGNAINRLIGEITAREFADALGDRLGVPNLSAFPVLVTICSRLNKRHGTIHTDSRSKIASALLYLNEDWTPGSAGSLRLLASADDIESVLTPEIPPLYGTLVAFRRAENSFHGHLPFEGERRVIQFAWLADRDALERKTRRGHMQRLLKRVFGPLDRWLGSRRGANAAHRD